MPQQHRPARLSVLSLCVLVCAAPSAHASILTFSGTTRKVPPFPKGATLDVCIQADPDGLGRSQLLKEGIQKWKKRLAARGIGLTVKVLEPGDPLPKPGGTTGGQDNKIVVRWAGTGLLPNGMQIGPGVHQGAGQPIAAKGGEKLVGGEAVVWTGLPTPSDDTKKHLLRNVGEHEFGHILGLAHEANGAVMKPVQTGDVRNFADNNPDKREFNELYGTKKTGGAKQPQGKVEKIGGGAGMGFFQYRVEFEPANAVADPDDPEHVAFMTFGVRPSLVSGLALPSGWVGLIPAGPVLISDPFFTTDDYMTNAAPNPTPWEPGPAPRFIALRTSAAEAALDGLPPDFDPALSLDNPSVELTIFSSARAERARSVWAGGELQSVSGPFVPEPSSVLLFGSGLLGLAGWRRRRA